MAQTAVNFNVLSLSDVAKIDQPAGWQNRVSQKCYICHACEEPVTWTRGENKPVLHGILNDKGKLIHGHNSY